MLYSLKQEVQQGGMGGKVGGLGEPVPMGWSGTGTELDDTEPDDTEPDVLELVEMAELELDIDGVSGPGSGDTPVGAGGAPVEPTAQKPCTQR